MSHKKTTRMYLQKITTFTVGLICVFSLVFSVPQKTHAQLLTFDVPNLVNMIVDWGIQYGMSLMTDGLLQKEVVWDTIANAAAKAALQSMAQSMTNWAASGFDGSPTFVTNYRNHMLQVQDGAVEDFLTQLQSDGRIQSPFSSTIAQDIRETYYRGTGTGSFGASNPYTLRQSCANDQAFLSGDFMQCGLSGWFSTWTNPANNPIGSSLFASDALLSEARRAGTTRTEELRWGDGFLPAQNCGTEGSAEGETATEGGSEDTTGGEGEATEGEVSLSETQSTQNCATRTPSSVVAHSANKFFVDLGVDIGVAADEIDELIANFFVNLVTDSLQGDGGLASGSAGTGRPALGTDGNTGTPTAPRSCSSIPTTGGNPPSSNAINAVTLSIDNLFSSIEQFQSRWQSIKDVAEQAKTKLLSCGASDTPSSTGTPSNAQRLYDNEVKTALDRATSSIDRASQSLIKLEEFRTRAEAAKNGQESFERLACEFQEFQSSGIAPTPSEMIYVAQNSTELPDELDPNLFTKFKNISEDSCGQINADFGT